MHSHVHIVHIPESSNYIYITFLLPNHVDSLKFNVNSVPSGYNLIASVPGPGNDMCELHCSSGLVSQEVGILLRRIAIDVTELGAVNVVK